MPRAVYPTLLGKPRSTAGIPAFGRKAEYVGDEAMSKKGVLSLEFPIENGIIKNWDAMLSIWSHAFLDQLRVKPEEYPVLITDSDRDPKVNKEKIAQIMFEKLHVPSLFIVNPGILSLYGNAVITGTAVDCGECLTLCVPCDGGMAETKAMGKKYFGGRNLTAYLTNLLNEKENLFQSTGEQYTVKAIKEEACYVAMDPKETDKNPPAQECMLPDGTKISLSTER
jgi:actin beta/gamma 1